jgi:hypothetical protein
MTIRRTTSGKYYCDGSECGYPLAWVRCDPEEGADGEWVCLDCNDSIFAAAPTAAHTPKQAEGQP